MVEGPDPLAQAKQKGGGRLGTEFERALIEQFEIEDDLLQVWLTFFNNFMTCNTFREAGTDHLLTSIEQAWDEFLLAARRFHAILIEEQQYHETARDRRDDNFEAHAKEEWELLAEEDVE